jgi:hypothetical protein
MVAEPLPVSAFKRRHRTARMLLYSGRDDKHSAHFRAEPSSHQATEEGVRPGFAPAADSCSVAPAAEMLMLLLSNAVEPKEKSGCPPWQRARMPFVRDSRSRARRRRRRHLSYEVALNG